MTFAPVGLILSQKQVEVLTELGIDHTKLYFIDNDKVSSHAPSLNAYSSGHYLIFSSDVHVEELEMKEFVKAMYGPGEYELAAKFRNLFIWATPSAKFVLPVNLVTVTIAPVL